MFLIVKTVYGSDAETSANTAVLVKTVTGSTSPNFISWLIVEARFYINLHSE